MGQDIEVYTTQIQSVSIQIFYLVHFKSECRGIWQWVLYWNQILTVLFINRLFFCKCWTFESMFI